ncbi:MAG: transcriptional regulator [Burkholderiales bacterium RIFCSPLOWO2_12_FULL_61_40]|nr:MAG: transcriptional regulator [Burkholderiales bacterium RIFCSPLOWO2_12_FULL_61_40]
MDSISLMNRIRGGEDSTLELKRIVWRGAGKINEPHPDSLADELAAFANAKGGLLVLGVDDKTREVVGIEANDLDAAEKWLSELARDRINPPLQFYTHHVELLDTNGLLRYTIAVDIPRSLWIHKSPKGYMHRIGHEKREMSPELLARMFQQRSQARLLRFEEQVVPGTSLNDIHNTKYLINPNDKADMPTQLGRLHLITKDEEKNCLSVAGVLLCSKTPNDWLRGAYIQAVAYRGTKNDPADQLDAKDFTGPIADQIEYAFDFVMRHMLVPAKKDLGRVEYPQYSRRAVFEAIVNAVAHRDYSIHGARIRLFMFADRLELCVPGPLPNTMSIDAMTSMSLPRNDVLCSLLARIPVHAPDLGRAYLMDKRGAGVDVILSESFALSGRMPLYRQIADMELQLTIYAAPSPHTD